MSDATNEQALTATPYHPEEIKAVFEMRMGNTLSFQATARCTRQASSPPASPQRRCCSPSAR